MNLGHSEREVVAVAWWRRLWARVVAILSGGPALLPRLVGRPRRARLSDELHELYAPFEGKAGVVGDTVRGAVQDYQHLREVVMGPGATADAVDDVTLLAEAEHVLREVLLRAPELQVLVELASERGQDREGREATGEAILQFCDRGRAMHQLASAALRWASSQSAEDLARMRACAEELSS